MKKWLFLCLCALLVLGMMSIGHADFTTLDFDPVEPLEEVVRLDPENTSFNDAGVILENTFYLVPADTKGYRKIIPSETGTYYMYFRQLDTSHGGINFELRVRDK
ncbi:MAG: hypothetical protein IJU50_02005, partial [Lachnospiraceae bacterium]|nr:hypothetical protein [Lachnospiraceae bacterium]